MRQNILPVRVTFFSRVVILAVVAIACAKSGENKARADSNGTEVAASEDDAAGGVAASPGDNTSIVVNGEVLAPETVRQLQQVYPVQVPPGRYWYDPVSGAWGREGQRAIFDQLGLMQQLGVVPRQ